MPECEKCAESAGKGYGFCISCGNPLDPKPKGSTLAAAIKIIGVFVMFACAAMLFFESYAVFWGMNDILTNIHGVRIFVLTPSPAILTTLTGVAAKVYYVLIAVAAIASFAVLLYMSRDGIKGVMKKDLEKVADTPLYGVATLFVAVVSFNFIFNMVVSAFGNTPTVPGAGGPPWTEWFSLLYAAVWEEVLCRVLMIGLPVALIGLLLKEKGSWKRLFGRFEVDGTAVVFILAASLIFAYAHLSEWDVFKLAPTFVSGLALGYLFVKYGVYASIMLHLLINYLSSVDWVIGGELSDLILGLFIMMTILLGVLFLAWYAVSGLKGVKRIVSDKKPPETVP